MLAREDGQKAYRVRHRKLMQFRWEALAEFLSLTQEGFQKAEEIFHTALPFRLPRALFRHRDGLSRTTWSGAPPPAEVLHRRNKSMAVRHLDLRQTLSVHTLVFFDDTVLEEQKCGQRV